MSKYLNFYELPVWIKARAVTSEFYILFEEERKREYWIKDQMLRALLSIMNNLAEGFDSERSEEQVRFYEYSKRSASEVESMLFVMQDAKMLSIELFEKYQIEVTEIRKQLSSLINYSKNRK